MNIEPDTPIRALGRGVLAGAVGTAVMTAAQTVYYKATGSQPSSTPAEVANGACGALNGRLAASRRCSVCETPLR